MRQMLGNQGRIGKNWNIGTEQDFIEKYEGKEAYTTLYGFYNLPEDKAVIDTRTEDFLKESGLCFDRLVFDFDNKENPYEAINQGIALREWFKSEFSDLYSEIWFSGDKGCHVYLYFEPIIVENPKLIYSHIFDVLNNNPKFEFNYLDSALKNVYAGLLRVKNSRHPKTGYYKVNITNAVDAGLINSMEDIYRIAEKPTVTFPKFNHDSLFNEFIHELDKTVTETTPDADTNNKYITSNATEPLQKALADIWKKGQRDKVAFPLLHCLYRAGYTEQEAVEFFSFLPESEYNEIIRPKIHTTYHNPLSRKVGIPTLKRNWADVGGDLTAIDDYFTIISNDSVFYPYKPPIVDDSNIRLPEGWIFKGYTDSTFTFTKDNLRVEFKNMYIKILDDNNEVLNKKWDKKSLSTMAKDAKITQYELESLYEATVMYRNNRTNEFVILSGELNERLGSGQVVKTARTIAKYFHNRQAWSTPKGTVMMGVDNIGRLVTENDLKDLLYEDFKPKQLITSDYFKYIKDLPEITPDYNMIHCNNGFFDFNTGKFSTRANEPLVILKESPYNYRPELIGAPVPDDLQLLFDNLYNATPKTLLQVIGYLLTDNNPLKIVPIFIGDNDTGKSVIIIIIGALVNNNISSVDIFNIKDTDYGLITNDLNLISEFRGTTRAGLALLKQYSGNESMNFRLLYTNSKAYPPESISKTIISTNNLTNLTKCIDKSTLNRFTCYIEFKKSYKGEPDTGIEDRILSNNDAMDWLLTNSIHEFMSCNMNLESTHTILETQKLIQEYDNPMKNHILEKYEYIPPNYQLDYANELGYTNGMDDREFLIAHGVTMEEIKNFYESYGEVAPKRPITQLKEFFEVSNIDTIRKTVNNKRENYIMGLVRK